MSAYRFGDYSFDVGRRLLRQNERVVPLSAKLCGLLYCLVRSGGRTVTKDELAGEGWRREDVSDATIVQHIWLLRRLFGERADDHGIILTVPREGYQFLLPVSHISDTEGRNTAIAIADSHRGEPRVWREFSSGIYCAKRRDLRSLRLALKHFNAALGFDPTFAPAWTGIAGVYSNLAFYAFATWDQVLPSAWRAIDKALHFDPSSALALCVRSQIELAQWDVTACERSLERAGNADARAPAVYHLSSFLQVWRGEFELAMANARRMVAAAPEEIASQGMFANALAAQGDFQNAIASYTHILELEPTCRIARQGRCEAYVASGEFQLALNDLEPLPRTPANVSRLACIHAFLGDRFAAARLFGELERRSQTEYVEAHCFAQVHVALGRHDEAARLTDRALASNDLVFPAMLSSPLLHRSMKDRRLRQTLGDIRNRLCGARRKIG